MHLPRRHYGPVCSARAGYPEWTRNLRSSPRRPLRPVRRWSLAWWAPPAPVPSQLVRRRTILILPSGGGPRATVTPTPASLVCAPPAAGSAWPDTAGPPSPAFSVAPPAWALVPPAHRQDEPIATAPARAGHPALGVGGERKGPPAFAARSRAGRGELAPVLVEAPRRSWARPGLGMLGSDSVDEGGVAGCARGLDRRFGPGADGQRLPTRRTRRARPAFRTATRTSLRGFLP